jgi:hypothetical protein
MKTAVSLPDPLFEEAERVAARLGVSRSELYARAIASFVREHRGEAITEAINQIVRSTPPKLDPVLSRMQAASIGPDEGAFDEWVAPSAKARSKQGG